MKYRTFLTTLILFLLSFNLGIAIICVTTFKDMVHRAEEKSLDEHYFITSALLKDFHAVESRGIDIGNSLASLFQPYSYLSGDKKVKLALYKGDQLVYSNRQEIILPGSFLEPLGGGNRLVSIKKLDDRTYIMVSGQLPAPYDFYTMVYLYDTTDAITAWKQMKNMLFFAGFILSSLLALGLLLLLNRIFKPLSQISQISRNIAAGAYETRLPVSGHDELSEMAQSFNHMAEEIQRQIQQLATAAEQKQQFVDNLAHELRTPLTAIYGYAEYIQKIVRTEEDKLFATNYIMSESRRLQNIAYHLLDLATLRENKIERSSIRMGELVDGIEQSLSMKAAEQNIRIIYEYRFDTLFCNADLMHILLVNLIDNAMKACSPGGIIKLVADLEDGHKVISVQDNGKGMTEEHLIHITEAFYRVDSSRSRSGGGAGLGLTLCKQIAVNHEAELSFLSEPGRGTTAKLTFTS
ncbi:sensor histidine kinase [Aneurinibacillus aneurinilyticus]|jgi:signal transduction histidine kinase|uniref:histidine kinase n=1 Tax=Aneurinibacillus aneurinilyticus ATCC 12856 TaxID=649747 RepID=U1Y988_ANEAE|nr:HAMP domain-containing sensor histidine kinase [Aneurinibacillus aneurinilyticus]ERI07376.1 ATPase/histidine kinase/DNA gyrase B/HSP90 domain protein [Aneurinibacillus aneurinilyticus ATCC 12856]MCI1693383.1 HAMP domain-containing histidine kinase [Aneurinibacillus aneurinilyticus]MED0707559.1 HAMP domain-containing sensor histidine kinase [Aneurinibacillus aneurinilyticus]MED0723926.1 HAMP domain-containing sensor histidine kinase [Aneurinibacillus aneurinilyticus]MED0735029.1 HAMP domain-